MIVDYPHIQKSLDSITPISAVHERVSAGAISRMSGDRSDPAEASLGCLSWLMSVTVDVDRLGRAWAQPRHTHRSSRKLSGEEVACSGVE